MRIPKAAGLIALGLVIGATSVGVGVAATAHPKAVKACADKKGALVLLQKGKCPKGTKGLSIGVVGPAGPAGAPGGVGPAGAPGHDGADQAALRNVVTVDATGTSTANGTALIAAVAGLTSPSANNPYLVRLGIGTYDLGGKTLTLPAGVSLLGQGPSLTTLTSSQVAGAATLVPTGGDVGELTIADIETGAFGSVAVNGTGTLHDCAVHATAQGAHNIIGVQSTSITLERCDVLLDGTVGAAQSASGFYGSGDLIDDTIRVNNNGATRRAIYVPASDSVSVTGGLLQAIGGAGYGIYLNASATAYVRGSNISGDTAAIYTAGDANVAGTELLGAVTIGSGGEANCVGDFDHGFTALNATCA